MTRPEDRPDPLAEPPRRPRQPPRGAPPGPDLSVCAAMPNAIDHCGTPPVVILWIGCTRGEHAGPMAYCAHHATPVHRAPLLTCAQCGAPVKVMKITSMDGESTVADFGPPAPPPGLWRRAVPE